jgi:parvulin-like peptidyl-prolyl isomerase
VRRKVLAGVALVGVLALLIIGAGGCGSGGGLPANISARVGGTDITQDQFNAELAVFKGIFAGQYPDAESNPSGYKSFEIYVLNTLVTYEMVTQKANSLNISVTDQEVQNSVDQIKQNSFGGDQAKMDAAFKQSGLTLDQLKTYYRQLLLIQKAYTEVTKNTAGPTDAEISAYYDAHKSSFYQQETRVVRHILIAPAGLNASSSGSSTTSTTAPDAAAWDAALMTAQKVREDLLAGADWKTEAAQYSDDTATKNNGGDLGTVSKGQMVAEFDQAVFSLALNEISQPIKTVYGYHIIQVTAINAAKQLSLDEAKSQIQSTLLTQNQKADFQTWLDQTKAELHVVYAQGMEPTTTTTTSVPAASESTSSSSGTDGASTTAPAVTSTTIAPAVTVTTTPGATVTAPPSEGAAPPTDGSTSNDSTATT